MLFHVDNVDNFVHNLIFQHFFIFLKVENFLPINSPIHIFFKSLCNLLISTLFDIFPCKISYLQYLTKYTQINFILSPFPFVSWHGYRSQPSQLQASQCTKIMLCMISRRNSRVFCEPCSKKHLAECYQRITTWQTPVTVQKGRGNLPRL